VIIRHRHGGSWAITHGVLIGPLFYGGDVRHRSGLPLRRLVKALLLTPNPLGPQYSAYKCLCEAEGITFPRTCFVLSSTMAVPHSMESYRRE